jgi:hypothetical protein
VETHTVQVHRKPTPQVFRGTLSIDSGHVRALRSYQVRTFEVFVAQVSNDDGEQIVFSSVPLEADRRTQHLSDGLISQIRAFRAIWPSLRR